MPEHRYNEEMNDRNFSLDKKNGKKKNRTFLSSIVSIIFFIIVILAAVTAVTATFLLVKVSKDLPSSEEILAHEPSLATTIYDRNGRVITHLFQENRNWVKLDDVSPWMVKAILAAEDNKFYEHSGIRPIAIARAAVVDFFHRGARQGGSTITQQLARNLFLSKEKTISRKAKEAVLALRLEKIYTKDQLLEMYLNTIYMGHGAYGIDAAAKAYYNKSPAKLTIAESAILAGLVAAPEKYSPMRNRENSDSRKEYVLRRMLDLDWISKADYDSSMTEQPRLNKSHKAAGGLTLKDAPYFVSYILFNQLLPTYGTEQVYRGGMKVYTTIDLDLQKKAESAVSGMRHEGALVAIDPSTGEILALVGGRNFDNSKFNRATQAYRQPGSAFKPIVYAAALENGYRAIDHVLDAPLLFENGWSPANYEKGFSGEITLIDALARSINTAAVRLAQIVGVDKVIDMARRMGISTPHMPEDLSVALGTASVTPLEMCVAYSTFANNGYKVQPYGIKEIDSSTGETLEQTGPKLLSAMSVTNAATMRSMLEQVMKWGTGTRGQIDGYESFGKTGTTNDWTDAWFAGGVPGLVAVVYTGNDNHKPLGGHSTGSVAALPVWKTFMTYAVKKMQLQPSFVLPPDAGVEATTVCRKTGFLAAGGCRTANILLPTGQVPTSKCPWHGGSLSAAKTDENAPQLILAPIDDEETRFKYARGSKGTQEDLPTEDTTSPDQQTADSGADTEQPAAQDTQANTAVQAKKPKPGGSAKVPSKSQGKSVYSNPKEAQDMEKKYQELLQKYNISD